MLKSGLAALAGILLFAMSPGAQAQGYSNGGYSNGMRNGSTSGGSSGGTTTTTPSAGYPSTVSPATRNYGTGQSRPEGALGMTPQLQRELGIGRQQ